MPRAAVRDSIYRRRRYSPEIIELCVRWYITYRLSYRDLVAMRIRKRQFSLPTEPGEECGRSRISGRVRPEG